MLINRIRVHLVHGTWARGHFVTSKAWSEAGHEVYEKLRTLLPMQTAIETFLWSGENSVSAREQAAKELRIHLENSLKEFPNDRHVVIAHSHGGTISILAMADPKIDGRIERVICLATPFTYVMKSSPMRIHTGILSATSVGYALYWTGVIKLFPFIPQFLGVGLFAGILAVKSLFAYLFVANIANQVHKNTPHSAPIGPLKSKVFLLRGSRDEASLVLSFAQVLNWIFYVFAKFHDPTMPTVRKPLTWLAYAVIYAACLLAGGGLAIVLHDKLLIGASLDVVYPLAVFVYAPAMAGMIFIVGCLALAIPTGFWDVRRWITCTVEVETAPPGTVCQMYVFSQVASTSLRHGLYEDETVIELVAEIVQG